MSNRIEQVIGDIEEYIEGCKMQAFSSTKIIVDRPQLEEFLDELRQYTPEEVKKYQRMLNNRDKILAEAKKKASEIEEKAMAFSEKLVSENQITQLAYQKAQEIIGQAQAEANEIMERANAEATEVRSGALNYTNEMLSNLHSIVTGTIDDCQSRYSALISSLTEHQTIIEQNAMELNNVEYDDIEPEQIAVNTAPFFETDVIPEEADEEEE